MGNFLVRADLHLHSSASGSQTAWYNRLFRCPESFTDPKEIYNKLKSQGIDFITITDHDTIDGVLEIADRPEVFISCEYTVEFPEEKAKVHILVYGLSEREHEDLIRLKENVYEFVGYLKERDLAHSLAHPLYSVEGTKITERLIEKMVLLFDTWEGINGTRGDGVRYIEEAIAKVFEGWENIYRLAEKHGITPLRRREKISFTAGSDDHGGLDVGRTWTAVENAKTVEEFLQALKEGKTKVGTETLGEDRILKTILRVAFEYGKGKNYIPSEVAYLLDYTFKNPHSHMAYSLIEAFLGEEISEKNFREVIKTLPALSLAKFWKNPNPKHLGEVFLGLGIHLLTALIKYAQKSEEERIKRLAQRLKIVNGRSPKEAYLVDTYPHVNGVSRSSEIIRDLSSKYDFPIYLFICSGERIEADKLIRLEPLFEIPTPFYEEIKLGVPNLMELIEILERKAFTQVHVATPGPLGLAGLLAGKILGLKITSTYHTDLPTYAKIYTLDEQVELLVWRIMKIIANLTDQFFVPSKYYQDLLIEKGVSRNKVKVFRRGVDTTIFSPVWRDRSYWEKTLGVSVEHPIVLYVGRISREKNLDTLNELAFAFGEASFVVVGEGPYRKELEAKASPNVYFLGYKSGQELATIYASADIFLFPSETETYGLVVLEAMASGLPVIVSSQGAAKEHILEGVCGYVANSFEDYKKALSLLLRDKALKEEMGAKARLKAMELDLIKTYQDYINSITGKEDYRDENC